MKTYCDCDTCKNLKSLYAQLMAPGTRYDDALDIGYDISVISDDCQNTDATVDTILKDAVR